MSLAPLLGFARALEGVWWDDRFPLILVLSKAATLLPLTDHSAWLTLQQYGFVLFDRPHFEGVLAESLDILRPVINGALPGAVPSGVPRLLEGIDDLRGTIAPARPGPLARFAGQKVLIDVSACSFALKSHLTVGKAGGEAANRKATAFELQVQAMLDQSAWRPPADVKMVRGRTLTLGGIPITNLDALATHGNVLLLVDCKSVAVSAEYESAPP